MKKITLLLLVCLLINISIGSFIAISNSAYFKDYTLNENPDADHYVLLGINVLTKGKFSRMNQEPYTPDLLRTPVYPLIAGIFSLKGKAPWLLYTFQVFLQLLTVILIFYAGRLLWNNTTGLFAAALYIFDLSIAGANFEALSEPTFNLLISGVIVLLLKYFRSSNHKVQYGLAVALLLGTAILTRPTALYLPVVVVVAILIDIFRLRVSIPAFIKSKRHLEWVSFIIIILLIVLPWIIRNKNEFGVAKLTNVDAMNYVYYLGAGAYQMHYGIPLEAAQDTIAKEFNLRSNLEHHNPWMVSESIGELDRQLRNVTKQVVLKYPIDLIKSIFGGLAKSTIAHNVSLIAACSDKTWNNPGLDNLISGKISIFITNCFSNNFFLVLLFLFQIFYMPAFWALSVIGTIVLLVNKKLTSGNIMLLLVGMYFLLTMVLGGLDATHRFRVVIIPVCSLLGAFGFNFLVTVVKAKVKMREQNKAH